MFAGLCSPPCITWANTVNMTTARVVVRNMRAAGTAPLDTMLTWRILYCRKLFRVLKLKVKSKGPYSSQRVGGGGHQGSYSSRLIGQWIILNKWSLVFWRSIRGWPPLQHQVMKCSPQVSVSPYNPPLQCTVPNLRNRISFMHWFSYLLDSASSKLIEPINTLFWKIFWNLLESLSWKVSMWINESQTFAPI